jgi:crotonobetainyl-CoA:carnitine CoA-transferase CaiB-like acyl-CoA transferase
MSGERQQLFGQKREQAPPLSGVLVLDMSQFLSGPSAALRLGDLGARVIKIERPGGGDICRTLYLTDTDLAGDSTLFHAINRNKESFAADLKHPEDLRAVKQLIAGPTC